MRRSIRWRLQLWYGLVLLTVVAGFAGILYGQVRAARFRETEATLEAAVLYLDAILRRFPPDELEGDLPEPPPPPPPPPPFPPGAPPPRHNRERLLMDLALPRRDHPPEGDRGSYFAVWRADGSMMKAINFLGDTAPPYLSAGPRPSRLVWKSHGPPYREMARPGPGGTRLVVGLPIGREQAELWAFAWQLVGAGAVVLAVGLAGGWVVSGRILRPVAAITATASAISATNLSERIDVAGVDVELAELARVLNATFDRLEAAFERQARFTADASHELRTPLAILRSHAELALNRPRSAEEYRAAVETGLRAAQRMTALVEGLLTLARADAGKLDLRREPVDLRRMVEESVALFRPLAEERDVSLAASLDPAEVTGDPVWLAQVVTNLLSNAVQYNRPGGEVRVQLGVAVGEVVLSVADTGCGIPEEDRPHLFERFYRVDKARSRASGGNGLGLAICRSIVEAHGGTIGFETEPGQGSTFWVRLPCANAASG
jgi:two-component system OmpR family sensor kinase